MKTLKVLLQEVVSGIKAWVNSNFAQESNTVHKTGNETITGNKTFTSVVQANGRFKYMDTTISDKNPPGADRAVDTLSHLGSDGTYWGGLKHIWGADGISVTEFAVANHLYYNNTWNQGYWSVKLSATKDFSSISFHSSGNNNINLGSDSHQWKSVYAQTYYYNGTAFTDKFVTTDSVQTISVEKKFTVGFSFKNTAVTSHTTAPSSETNSHFIFLDGNDRYWGGYSFYWLTDGTTETRLQHTNYSTSGSQGWWQLVFGATKDFNNVYFRPLNNATINLGDSTHKWKTLNGINPGALSFPNIVANPNNANPPTGYISIDTTNWDLTNYTINWYTTPTDGWVLIAGGADSIQIDGGAIHYGVTNTKGADGFCESFLPVPAGCKIQIRLKNCTNLSSANFFPCLGNV